MISPPSNDALIAGVNEVQSIANATGSTTIQTDINERGVEIMRSYFNAYTEFLSTEEGNKAPSLELPELLFTLGELVEEEKRGRGKLVDLLLTSCYASRLLNACRTTSCKSAKDRTSVFHTLEIARLAQRSNVLHRYFNCYLF